MKSALIFIFLLFSGHCFSQITNYEFPQIKEQGYNKESFIPIGWQIRDSAIGDYNKDGLLDIAIVIETEKPLSFEDTTCFSTEPFYPKILLVYFRQKDNILYLSTSATKLFGNCNWGVQSLDPFVRIEERRNTLGIEFLTGGTERDGLSYYFRYQNNDWYLIGAESCQYWAGHLIGKVAFYIQAINFVTGVKEDYDIDEHHKKISSRKSAIAKRKLIKLSSFDENTLIPFNEY